MFSDVLSDVLRTLRATGTVYFCDQLDAPWEKQYPGDTTASFHQIRRGSCRLESGDLTEYLGPGDLVFIAPGRAHVLSSDPVAPEAKSQSTHTLLMCGYCEFDNSVSAPLSDLFPDVIVIRDEQLQLLGGLKAILDHLSHEYLSMRPGTEIVVNRLTEVLIVELIRLNFGRNEQAPLIKALADKYVGQALRRLHSQPDKAWSLELLAADVGLSRAGFAKRFKSLVGQSMFDYLTVLRMQRACQLLTESQLPLYDIANRVGYESDLAFARTFKKRLGLTPTAFRKQAIQNTSST